MPKGNPPVKRFKLRRVECAVWARPHEDGTRYSITFQKSYYDNEAEAYVNSGSFFPEEAALIPVLAQQAVAWILEQSEWDKKRAKPAVDDNPEKPF